MRRGEKHHVTGAQCPRIRDAEVQIVIVATQIRVHIGDAGSVLRARGDDLDPSLRVLRQQPEQLNTGVTGSTNNANFDHHYFPNRLYVATKPL